MRHNPGFKLCLSLLLLQCIIDKMMSPAFVSFTMLFKRISNFRAFIFKYEYEFKAENRYNTRKLSNS